MLSVVYSKWDDMRSVVYKGELKVKKREKYEYFVNIKEKLLVINFKILWI